jgi:hypothetical protein
MSETDNRQLSLGFHYNTTHLTGYELHKRNLQADSEARLVLAYFRMRPDELKTPFEVCEDLGYEDPLKVLNIRRAMSDLTRAGYLVKTTEMKQGKRGTTNHCWRLA